jgi:hypothetical protein
MDAYDELLFSIRPIDVPFMSDFIPWAFPDRPRWPRFVLFPRLARLSRWFR